MAFRKTDQTSYEERWHDMPREEQSEDHQLDGIPQFACEFFAERQWNQQNDALGVCRNHCR
jgi:hypothetical protein